jgi:hypothetical protein
MIEQRTAKQTGHVAPFPGPNVTNARTSVPGIMRFDALATAFPKKNRGRGPSAGRDRYTWPMTACLRRAILDTWKHPHDDRSA